MTEINLYEKVETFTMSLALPLLILLLINISHAQELNESVILTTNDLNIKVRWEPVEIKPNELVRFELTFLKNNTLTKVNYDFIVLKDEKIIKEVRNSFADDGRSTHLVEFPSSGSFSIIINILDSNESVTFDVKVTPEFPAGIVIVMVTLMIITIVLARLSILNSHKNTNHSNL